MECFFRDTDPVIYDDGLDGLPFDQVIGSGFNDPEHLRNVLCGIGPLPDLLSRLLTGDLLILQLIGIPVLEACDVHPHFPDGSLRLKIFFVDQPIALCFFQTKKVAHLSD